MEQTRMTALPERWRIAGGPAAVIAEPPPVVEPPPIVEPPRRRPDPVEPAPSPEPFPHEPFDPDRRRAPIPTLP
jgi:hypothetical protein